MSKSNPSRPTPSLLRRIPLAFAAFFSTLTDANFAARLDDLRRDGAPTQPTPAAVPPTAQPAAAPPTAPPTAQPTLRQAPTDAALQLLALFQRWGFKGLAAALQTEVREGYLPGMN